jgi:branched-chain amino acid transport system substrate-binding protein
MKAIDTMKTDLQWNVLTNNETQFSGFNVVIGIKRKTLIFLFKTLLLLLLLILVVYVTLFFPASLTKERLTIAISAMLASAVLLTAINNQLTGVGYTNRVRLLRILYTMLVLRLPQA